MSRRGEPRGQNSFQQRFAGKVATTTPSGQMKRVHDGRVMGKPSVNKRNQPRQIPHQVQQQQYGGPPQQPYGVPSQQGNYGPPGGGGLYQAQQPDPMLGAGYGNQMIMGGPPQELMGAPSQGNFHPTFDYGEPSQNGLPRAGGRPNKNISPRAPLGGPGRPMASAGTRRPRGGVPPVSTSNVRRPDTYSGHQRRENRNEELAQASPNGQLYFSRASRAVNYRPKTLAEYKRVQPQEYVELGKLPADLNSEHLIAKRANQQRIKDFSRNLRAINQRVITQNRHKSRKEKPKMLSTRDKARMYAENIPKPQGFIKNTPLTRIGRKENSDFNGKNHYEDNENDVDDENWGRGEMSQLDQLEMEHQSSRYNVDAIRREYGF